MIVYQKNPADGTGPSNKKLEEKKKPKKLSEIYGNRFNSVAADGLKGVEPIRDG